MRKGDTVRISYEGTLNKEGHTYVQLACGTCFTKTNATIEVLKHVYSIGDYCDYQGAKHVVAAIIDDYYVLSSPGLKPRLVAI